MTMFLRLIAANAALSALLQMPELNPEQPTGGGAGVQTSAQLPEVPSDPSPPAPLSDPRVTALESRVASLEAARSAPQQAGMPLKPTPGRIVQVRDHGRDCAGIVAEVNEDGSITCNVFRGDHMVHVASHLTQIPADATSRGWFWPPRS